MDLSLVEKFDRFNKILTLQKTLKNI